jgi:formylglycine-generating enzyme required for sulfatase activity
MPNRKLLFVSFSARWLALPFCTVLAILTPTAGAEQPANLNPRWVHASPTKVVWSSEGSAEVLKDHSIELTGSKAWQEVTLHYQFPELVEITRVLLEVLPSSRPRENVDQRMVLFDVKPHLKGDEKTTTRQLEFKSCRFLGNEADDTVANCIDFLSDTGWTVPDFVGKDACHQLVLELGEPITVQRNGMFAITIDSGSAPGLKALSRVRVSFSGIEVVANGHPDTALSAGTQDRTILNGMAFEFRWCPPGRFLMGSPPGSESKYADRFVRQHKVEITRGYWMMATEVTQAQYAAITEHNPASWQWRTKMQNPVEQVAWDDAVRFCEKLSVLDKENEYRLPTEAEWEYACRAGGEECRYGEILDIAWVFMNTESAGEGSGGHRPVGTKLPNRWGLHDMFGNVAEWCADWKAPPVREHQTDPRGPAHGEYRVVRGDDCFADPGALRSDGACMAGSRLGFPPSTASRVIGFRIVRVPRSDGTTKR